MRWTATSSVCTACAWREPSSSSAPNPTSRPPNAPLLPPRRSIHRAESASRRSRSPGSTRRRDTLRHCGAFDSTLTSLRRWRYSPTTSRCRRSPSPGFAAAAGRWSWPRSGSDNTSKNAAVRAYVLVAIVRKRLVLEASLSETLQILSLTMFETTPLDRLLTIAPPSGIPPNSPNQLDLLES